MNEKNNENRRESDNRNERDEWENPSNRDGNETFDPTPDDQARVDAQFADLVSNLDDFGELDEMEPLGGQTEPELSADAQRELEAEISELDRPQETTEDLDANRVRVVFLTPLASADALAALCALSDIELVVVPTEAGAVGVLELNLSEEAFGMALIADTLADFDPSVSEIASILSQLTRVPVVVLSALLAPGTEQEPGVTGQVLAGRWTNGEFETDLPSGLVLVQMPLQIEDLLLGRVAETEVAGAVETKDIAQWKAMKMLGKGLRKPWRGKK